MTALLDTSVFIAREQGRPLDALPEAATFSVLTRAVLRVGVLVATESGTRAQRMRTLERLESVAALPVDDDVSREFAEIVAAARGKGHRPRIIDGLIAATARAHRMPLYTQDADFERIDGLEVVRV